MAMWWNSSSAGDIPAKFWPLRARSNTPLSPWRVPAVTASKGTDGSAVFDGPSFVRPALPPWVRVALVALLVSVPGSINLSITLLPFLLGFAMLQNPPVRRRPTFWADGPPMRGKASRRPHGRGNG